MKTVMKLLLLTLLITIAGSTIAEYTSAQGLKIGYVNEQRIRTEYKDFSKAEEEYNLELKSWEEEATNKQTELQELLAEYDKQKLILSEDKKREKEAAIRTKQEDLDAYTRRIFGPGGTAERKEQELVTPILERISKVIEAIAIEENYDVIYTTSALVYIKPIFDITDKVLERLAEATE